MALENRHASDEFAVVEKLATYQELSTLDRLALLRETATGEYFPTKLFQAAAEDASPLIRAWAARTLPCNSDDRPLLLRLFDVLRADPSEYVRLSCLQNPRAPMLDIRDGMRLFLACSPLERLSLVRNPGLPSDVILALFDFKDARGDLTPGTRLGLIEAFLTNEGREPVQANSEAGALSSRRVFGDPARLGDEVWQLATQWPEGITRDGYSEWQVLVFEHVVSSAEQRARSFTQLKHRWSRAAILRLAKCYEECVRLATTDDDDDIRGYGCAKYHFPRNHLQQDALKTILSGFDLAAMRGLARNCHIAKEDRRVVWRVAKLYKDMSIVVGDLPGPTADTAKTTGQGQRYPYPANQRCSCPEDEAVVPLLKEEECISRLVRDGRIVLPSVVAELSGNGILDFCGWGIDDAPWSRWFAKGAFEPKGRFEGVFDAGEIRDRIGLGRGVRLQRAQDVLDIEWDDDLTSFQLDRRRTATFDSTRCVRVSWNGTIVLDLHLGGDRRSDECLSWTIWYLTMVKVYVPGPWQSMLAPLCRQEAVEQGIAPDDRSPSAPARR